LKEYTIVQITVLYLNIETENIGGWYVFARRKGLKIYFFSRKVRETQVDFYLDVVSSTGKYIQHEPY
jgi:hypothetical protein